MVVHLQQVQPMVLEVVGEEEDAMLVVVMAVMV